jgi:hypothetical protein
MAVGKIQVEQHQRRCFHVQRRERVGQPGDTVHTHIRHAFLQAQAYQVGVSGVILNQQNMASIRFHNFYFSSRGRLTALNQNSSIDCTARK